MVRASWVLKRQLMVAWAVLRSVTRAWTSPDLILLSSVEEEIPMVTIACCLFNRWTITEHHPGYRLNVNDDNHVGIGDALYQRVTFP